ncbi:hypothetical protein, partial [Peptoanaerobacter stomatis]|uniref:hypothetical protein n=1 Tax=Peptoanaerobacter stomatis TaxID=796937 RepID=UPI003F9F0B73
TVRIDENNENDEEIDEKDYIITEDDEKITRNDIIQELDALGIKFDKRYSTQRLYNLIINC